MKPLYSTAAARLGGLAILSTILAGCGNGTEPDAAAADGSGAPSTKAIAVSGSNAPQLLASSAVSIDNYLYLKAKASDADGDLRRIELQIRRAADGFYMQADGRFASTPYSRYNDVSTARGRQAEFMLPIELPREDGGVMYAQFRAHDRAGHSSGFGFAGFQGNQLPAMIGRGRAAVEAWAKPRSVAAINAAVAQLSAQERARLLETVLDAPDATAAQRAELLATLGSIVSQKPYGIYVEILSHTRILVNANCCFYSGNQIQIRGNSGNRDMLMHELYHSFNERYAGASGSLNEGLGIFVFKAGDQRRAEGMAEALYGTELGSHYGLRAATNPSSKYVEFAAYLSGLDPSRAPWDSTAKMQACFDRYWAGLNRSSPTWWTDAATASAQMASDPACRPDGMQSVQLVPGWNKIDLTVRPGRLSVGSLLDSVMGSVVSVGQYDANNEWRAFELNRLDSVAPLETIDPDRPFWVVASRAVQWSVYGEAASSTAPVTMHFNPGFNGVRFPIAGPVSAAEMARRIGSSLYAIYRFDNVNGTWRMYMPGMGNYPYTLQTVEPDLDYYVYVTRSVDACVSDGC
ncbi:MAG: hypothetical protein R3E87_25380 [Burkholderiaceae bacterium]